MSNNKAIIQQNITEVIETVYELLFGWRCADKVEASQGVSRVSGKIF